MPYWKTSSGHPGTFPMRHKPHSDKNKQEKYKAVNHLPKFLQKNRL